MNNRQKLQNKYSAKVKDIFIELFGYTYFHGPSSIDHVDRRLIGREKIKRKFRSILTDTESKSGAYLVTGFRGMGKTSLVNSLLNSIQGKDKDSDTFYQYLRIFIIVIALAILSSEVYVTGLAIAVIIFIYLYSENTEIHNIPRFEDLEQKNRVGERLNFLYKISGKSIRKNISNNFLRIIRLNRIKSSKNVFVGILQELFVAVLICFLPFLLFFWANPQFLSERILVHFLCYLFFIFFHRSISSSYRKKRGLGDNLEKLPTAAIKYTLLYFAGFTVVNIILLYILRPKSIFILGFSIAYFLCIFILIVLIIRYIFGKKFLQISSRSLLSVVFLLPYITSLSFYCVYFVKCWDPSKENLLYFILSLFIITTIFLFNIRTIEEYRVVFKINRKNKHPWSLPNQIKQKVNYSHYINIRINLGQDNLEEIDVLRYIAKGVHKNYRRWYRTNFLLKRVLWKGLYFLMIFTISGTLYFYNPIYNHINQLRYTSEYYQYFPSQALFFSTQNDSTNLAAKLDKYIVDSVANSASIADYIDTIKQRIPPDPDSIVLNLATVFYEDFEGNNLSTVNKITASADYFIFVLYQKIYDIVSHIFPQDVDFIELLSNNNNLSRNFRLLPVRLDHFFILYFILFLLLVRLVIRIPFLNLTTHRQVLNKLDALIDNIEANVIRENSKNLPLVPEAKVPIFSFSTRKNYPILGAKSIESELITILDDIDRIPQISVRPKFIFIFDELDKIEPRYKVTISDKEEEMDYKNDFGDMRSDGTKKRQEVIAKILANTKLFLNTAKAKFIFIAGREMYDAFLADVSDRDSAIGSIFHEVIYVNSFFTDISDNRISDVTSMAERYVCQFLLPDSFVTDRNDYTLKKYNEYLSTEIFKTKSDNSTDETEFYQERIKIILTLYNFITYLAYRSNGAPKKLTHLFENFIRPIDEGVIYDANNVIVGTNHFNLYLRFGYHDQYKLGFTTYLFTPFLNSISYRIRQFGDKLLVSTFFLIDHLYKFHRFGFSWRHIELMPEIVAINKAPELREFINEIIEFLSKTHIREIFSGLYTFKFNRSITAEIKYISKISEQESAAFNFTLDESIQIKRHYYRKLHHLKNEHRNTKDFIHSVAFINMILGELHYYDQEYDDAIVRFLEAIHPLEKQPNELYESILLLRNKLKLGLALEKKKSLDSAFMTYNDLTSLVVNVREIDLEQLGLAKYVLKRHEVKEFVDKHLPDLEQHAVIRTYVTNKGISSKECIETYIIEQYFNPNQSQEIILIGRSRDKSSSTTTYTSGNKLLINGNKLLNVTHKTTKPDLQLKSWNSMETFYDFKGENIAKAINNFSLLLSKQEISQKSSTLETLRLVYQPFIAKLYIIEKVSHSGVTCIDIERVIEEFQFIIRPIKEGDKYLIEVEFYNKIGDLLFFKNCILPIGVYAHKSSRQVFLNSRKGKTKKGSTTACIEVNDILKNKFKIKQSKHTYYQSPYNAYCFYLKSLFILSNRLFPHKKISTSKDIFNDGIKLEKQLIKKYIEYVPDANRSSNESSLLTKQNIMVLANGLSDLGDTVLLFANENSEIDTTFLKQLIDFRRHYNNKEKENQQRVYKRIIDELKESLKLIGKKDSSIIRSLTYFILSSLFYSRGGFYNLHIRQIVKIFHVLNIFLKKGGNEFAAIKESLENDLIPIAIKGIHRSLGNTNRLEIDKIREILSFNNGSAAYDEKNITTFLYSNITLNADIKEVISLYNILKVKHTGKFSYPTTTSPFSIVSNKYYRILELRYKAICNYKVFEDLFMKVDDVEEILDEIKEIVNVAIDINGREEKLKDLEKEKREESKDYFLKNADTEKIFEKTLDDTIDLKVREEKLKDLKKEVKEKLKNYNLGNADVEKMFNFLNEIIGNIKEKEFKDLNKGERRKLKNYILKNTDTEKIFDKIKRIVNDAIDINRGKEKLKALKRKVIETLENYKLQITDITDIEAQIIGNGIDEIKNDLIDFINAIKIFLIQDSIFCYTEIIRAYHIYGTDNYAVAGKFSLGMAHLRLAEWCKYLEEYEEKYQDSSTDSILQLIDQHEKSYLSSKHHNEVALTFFYETYELHTGNVAYSNFIKGLHYLDDDFNDTLLHFALAIERSYINTSELHDRIAELSKKGSPSENDIYQYNQYSDE